MHFDVAIVGAGPAGASCAATCAAGGLKTLLLERARFPREKVCGDCLNPGCWLIFDRLDLSERVHALPHAKLTEVEFIGIGGPSVRVALRPSSRGEIALKRSFLDQLLLERAVELGADVLQGHGVTKLESGWKIHSEGQEFSARILVAADGRNSTVSRLLHLLPSSTRDRIGIQTHIPSPAEFGERVALKFLPEGYCGMASVGNQQLNLCLVARPPDLNVLKTWASAHFGFGADQAWRTITPLRRAAVSPSHENLLLVGDAARVVEPFTGEGIYYALASGELAGRHIVNNRLQDYEAAHRGLYRGRLWINELSRFTATHPHLATAILSVAQFAPGALRFLTGKVIGNSAAPSKEN